ncbi:MAG: hypothetical protein ACYTG6_06810 [Planctomycetota bacterium]|jgi:hypothetical protein
MRILPRLSFPLRLLPGIGPAAAVVTEVVALAAVVLAIEAVGPHVPHEGADLLGLLVATVFGMALVVAARSGVLPRTRRAVLASRRGIGRRVQKFMPSTTLAFRLPPGTTARGETLLLVPTFLLAAAVIAVSYGGEAILPGLWALKERVSYTLFLLLLCGLWIVLGTVAAIGLLASARLFAPTRPRPGGDAGAFRVLTLMGLWAAALVAFAYLPGIAPVVTVALVGAVFLAAMTKRPPRSYHLCRRDARGRLHATRIEDYLRRHYGLLVVFSIFVTALGEAPRLWQAGAPHGAFALTLGLGLAASVAALFLTARAGAHVCTLLTPTGGSPESPFIPVLWRPGGGDPADGSEEARRRFWRVHDEAQPPREGYDLVVSASNDPRAFRPAPGSSPDDAWFRLQRRLHVVKRREFHRRFRRLYKEVTAPPRPSGEGFLFCPHAWPVPGILRDRPEPAFEGEGGSRHVGEVLVGRPYAQVFSPRLRRYLGAVLGALMIDVVYWEDGVTWPDLRAVFGVLFESYDQGRHPVLERHFIGLPRLRITIQEPDTEDGEEAFEGAAAHPQMHARILVVRRDRGGGEEKATAEPPAERRRPGVLV